jgi:hypothetical protein
MSRDRPRTGRCESTVLSPRRPSCYTSSCQSPSSGSSSRWRSSCPIRPLGKRHRPLPRSRPSRRGRPQTAGAIQPRRRYCRVHAASGNRKTTDGNQRCPLVCAGDAGRLTDKPSSTSGGTKRQSMYRPRAYVRRRRSLSSARSRLTAELISARCVKACGKFPSASPEVRSPRRRARRDWHRSASSRTRSGLP